MDSNAKVFAAVSAFATLCITLVSLYAINKDASWASFGIVVGIMGACVTVAVPVASAIRLKMRQGREGDSEVDFAFEAQSAEHAGKQQPKAYPFSLTQGQTYTFPEKLLGADRFAYSFDIPEIYVMDGAAKFAIRIQRVAIGKEPETVKDDAFGLECGESVTIDGRRWQLTLEATEQKTAQFRVNRL